MTAVAVGIDIGGTKLAAATVDRDGRVLARARALTPAARGPGTVLDGVMGLVARLDAHGLPAGIASAGVIDPLTGRVRSSAEQLAGWTGLALAARGEERLGAPVAVDNDVNAAALAEARLGALRGARSGLLVAVGTGVGGGLVRDGEVERGATGTAGELGHVVVCAEDGRRCPCGARGHLEAYAAGPAIALAHAARAGLPAPLALPAVAARAAAGEEAARAAIADGGAVLGRALAGLANVLDPERIVLAGGVCALGAGWWEAVRAGFAADALPGPAASVVLAPAALGADAGVVGAALLVLDRVAGAAPAP